MALVASLFCFCIVTSIRVVDKYSHWVILATGEHWGGEVQGRVRACHCASQERAQRLCVLVLMRTAPPAHCLLGHGYLFESWHWRETYLVLFNPCLALRKVFKLFGNVWPLWKGRLAIDHWARGSSTMWTNVKHLDPASPRECCPISERLGGSGNLQGEGEGG